MQSRALALFSGSLRGQPMSEKQISWPNSFISSISIVFSLGFFLMGRNDISESLLTEFQMNPNSILYYGLFMVLVAVAIRYGSSSYPPKVYETAEKYLTLWSSAILLFILSFLFVGPYFLNFLNSFKHNAPIFFSLLLLFAFFMTALTTLISIAGTIVFGYALVYFFMGLETALQKHRTLARILILILGIMIIWLLVAIFWK